MLKLKRKLAEFAGFKQADIKKHYYFEVGGERLPKWIEPGRDWHIKLPDFPESLDACFKWPVPKVIDKLMAEQECSSDLAYAILFKKWLQELELIIPEAALALCLAIEKLIDKEEAHVKSNQESTTQESLQDTD